MAHSISIGIDVHARKNCVFALGRDTGEARAGKKRERAVQMHLNMSRIPQKGPKTFASFDFGRLRGKGNEALAGLPALANLYARRNLALIGPEGVGKTHLAQAYGRACCERGLPAYYVKARELSEKLEKAARLGSTHSAMNRLIRPACLIIDEMGRRGLDRECTDLLSRVVDARCEKDGPNLILMTSNFTADKWDEFFTGAPPSRACSTGSSTTRRCS